MSDLVAFLRARLDEDEVAAKKAADRPGSGWTNVGEFIGADSEPVGAVLAGDFVVVYDEGYPTVDEAAFIARHDPARVLREVEAKRAILRWHPSEQMRYIEAVRCPQCELTWPCPTVRFLATVYNDHPDYDPRWKP